MSEPVLEIDNLVKRFGDFTAIDHVSLRIGAGETLAVVGESGCGKTTLGRAAALLHRPDEGRVLLMGKEVGHLSRRAQRPLRRHVQMVFQDPFESLNPRLTVNSIVGEPLAVHEDWRWQRRKRRRRVAEMLEAVGMDPALGNRYPHEFSGGQRQRIALARALAPAPDLIVADEPVSALDVSIEGQILNLMIDLRDRFGLSYLFISHDLAAVDRIADRVAVMDKGRLVEEAPREQIFNTPRHPYTKALIAAIPQLVKKPVSAP